VRAWKGSLLVRLMSGFLGEGGMGHSRARFVSGCLGWGCAGGCSQRLAVLLRAYNLDFSLRDLVAQNENWIGWVVPCHGACSSVR